MTMMVCKCGGVLVSDGKVWRCVRDKCALSPNRPDKRVLAVSRLQDPKPEGPVGKPNSKTAPRRGTAVHNGKMSCCEQCNPMGYRQARRLEAKLRGKRR